MKKLAVIASLGLFAVATYGQGTVSFANGAPTAVSNILTGVRVVAGTTFRVALYYHVEQATAPTSADIDAGLSQGRAAIVYSTNFNTPSAGQFNAGSRTTPAAPGADAWFQVRAWEAAFGATYEQAVNAAPQGGRLALAGTSNVIRVTTGGVGSPPSNPGSLVNSGLLGFYIVPVPEPSVLGLGIIGIGALFLLRRRK